MPIASPNRPVSSWRLRPARARLGFAGLRPSLAPAASFFPPTPFQHTWLVCPLVLYSFLGPSLLHQLSSSWKFHSVSSFLLNSLICCIFPPTPNSSKNLFPVPNSGYLQVSAICQVLVSSPWLPLPGPSSSRWLSDFALPAVQLPASTLSLVFKEKRYSQALSLPLSFHDLFRFSISFLSVSITEAETVLLPDIESGRAHLFQ